MIVQSRVWRGYNDYWHNKKIKTYHACFYDQFGNLPLRSEWIKMIKNIELVWRRTFLILNKCSRTSILNNIRERLLFANANLSCFKILFIFKEVKTKRKIFRQYWKKYLKSFSRFSSFSSPHVKRNYIIITRKWKCKKFCKLPND